MCLIQFSLVNVRIVSFAIFFILSFFFVMSVTFTQYVLYSDFYKGRWAKLLMIKQFENEWMNELDEIDVSTTSKVSLWEIGFSADDAFREITLDFVRVHTWILLCSSQVRWHSKFYRTYFRHDTIIYLRNIKSNYCFNWLFCKTKIIN